MYYTIILFIRNGFDEVACDFLKKLLILDYQARISVEEALIHPFFDEIKI